VLKENTRGPRKDPRGTPVIEVKRVTMFKGVVHPKIFIVYYQLSLEFMEICLFLSHS